MNNKKPLLGYKNNGVKYCLQAGASLLELMISMVVGLFLVAGLVTNLISTKNSDRNREIVSEMDANALIALDIMRSSIAHAGYRSVENIALEKAFHTKIDGVLDNPVCRDGETRSLSTFPNNPTKDNGRADVITVVALADNPCISGKDTCDNIAADINTRSALFYTDCNGGGNTRDAHVVACSTDPFKGMPSPNRREAKIFSTFRLEKNERRIMCDGSRGGTQPIVDNVYAMQFLYGIRQENGSTIYKKANAVDTAVPPEWGLVRSVQIALLMQSSIQYVLDEANKVKKFTLLDQRIKITSPADQRRLFRVYSTTVNLENLNRNPLPGAR